jgi:[ribosomal protein S18]-alanine N-acetyltransferase
LGCKYRNRFLAGPAGAEGKTSRSKGAGRRFPLRDYNESVNFTLRDFRHQEFETLWRIDQQCFAPGISYSRLELATYLQRPGAFALVADTEDTSAVVRVSVTSPNGQASAVTLGFIVAETGSRGNGHIITIDVLPKARGVGVGSRLLRAVEDRLRTANCHSVILETAVDNHVALSFYKRHDYSVRKSIPRYYSNGVDGLVLKKDLFAPTQPATSPQ